jgi:hypothetical protein
LTPSMMVVTCKATMISLVGGMSFRSVDMPDGEGVTSLGDTVLAPRDRR